MSTVPPRSAWPKPLPQSEAGALLTEVVLATFRLNGPMTAGVLTNEIQSGSFAIPTTATWAAGDLWVVNARFDVQNPPPDLPYWISRVPGL